MVLAVGLDGAFALVLRRTMRVASLASAAGLSLQDAVRIGARLGRDLDRCAASTRGSPTSAGTGGGSGALSKLGATCKRKKHQSSPKERSAKPETSESADSSPS